jgi:hypothetical protein
MPQSGSGQIPLCGRDVYAFPRELPEATCPGLVQRQHRAAWRARVALGMAETTWLDATAQADLVRRGEVSPKELAEAALAAIETVNPQLDAVIRTRFETARLEADGVAPADVIEDAVAVFRRTREIRDLLISGAGAETAEYRSAQRAYYDAIKAMSDAMRKDLGNSPLGAAIMGGPLPETDEEAS